MPISSSNFLPPTIPALVHRHAGDAAFYWQQHDGAAHSPLVGLPQLLAFDRLLDAEPRVRTPAAMGLVQVVHGLMRCLYCLGLAAPVSLVVCGTI